MSKQAYLYIITPLILSLVFFLVAQEKTGRIVGKVVDVDGHPLHGVTVILLVPFGPPLATITDAEGSFGIFSLAPYDNYELRGECEGFHTVTKTGITVTAKETTQLNLVMEREELVVIDIPNYIRPHSGQHKQMQLTKQQIEAFRSAKTVRVVVEESYQDNKDKELTNVHLPIDDMTTRFLKFLGLQILSSDDNNYDLEIKIIAKGSPRLGHFKVADHASQLVSTIWFDAPNTPIYSVTIYTYDDVSPGDISEPITARRNPFAVAELVQALMNSYAAQISELMVEIFGISPLIARLNDENAEMRKYAAESLRYAKDQRSLEILMACLEDEATDVRVAAIKSLRGIDDPQVIEFLISTLKSEDKDIRMASAESLGHLKAPEVVGSLIDALKDEDEQVRATAAKSLGYIRDSQAIEPLINALKDKDKHVREAAVESLGYIDDSQTVEPLIDALKDKDKSVRAAALKALIWELDDPEEDAILKTALNDKAGIVREIAFYEIWLLDDEQLALEYLLSALTDKSEIVRAAAVGSLSDFYDEPHVIESIIAALKDKDKNVRAAAAYSLGVIDEPQVVEPLLDCLKDNEEIVRAEVLEAFMYSDDPRVVESLITALNDEDENFRMYADEVLECITSNSFDGDQKKWRRWWTENKEKFIKERRITESFKQTEH